MAGSAEGLEVVDRVVGWVAVDVVCFEVVWVATVDALVSVSCFGFASCLFVGGG